MKPTEQLTIAERYARAKEERFEKFLEDSFTDEALANEKLHDLEISEGITFQVRKPDMAFFQATGGLPLGMAEKLATAAQTSEKAAVKAFTELPAEQQIKLMVFATKMARYMCVNPRLVETPTADNHLAFDDLTQQDLMRIVNFGKAGGETAQRLSNFRGKRR